MIDTDRWAFVRSLELNELQNQANYTGNCANVYHILVNYVSVTMLRSFPYNGP